MGNPRKRKKILALQAANAKTSEKLQNGFVELPKIVEEQKKEVVEEAVEQVIEELVVKEEEIQEEKPSKKKKSLQGE